MASVILNTNIHFVNNELLKSAVTDKVVIFTTLNRKTKLEIYAEQTLQQKY